MKHFKKIISSLLFVCMILALYAPADAATRTADTQQKKILFVNQTISMGTVGNVSKKQIKWSSSNKNVVRITSTGKMTGVKQGAATVKAVNKNNKKVLATYKVTVKAFNEKVIKGKITMVLDNQLKDMEILGKKYCVVHSKAELDQLKKEFCTNYVKAGYGTEQKCKNTPFYKKLSGYKESFFKTKTLCIVEHTLTSIGQPTEVMQFIRKQDKTGKVYGQLNIRYLKMPENKVPICIMGYQEYFIELKNSDAAVLQGYKISVIK